MNNKVKEDIDSISLKVAMSKIGAVDHGIARINSKYLKDADLGDKNLVTLRSEDSSVTVRLVSDEIANEGVVSLREGDMEKLDVKEGDNIQMEPYTTVLEDTKEMWGRIKERFKKEEKEEEENK
jgi:hypothetical protein